MAETINALGGQWVFGKDAVSTVRAEHEARERSLLFVAATRAHDKLIVTSSETPSTLLPEQAP